MIKLLKPVDGKVIPMPEYNYRPLPIEGMELQLSAYWNDRVNQNDVFIDNSIEVEKTTKKTNKEV
jgi:hypothetical protein